MIRYDVVVVGAGKIGRKIAKDLTELGKKVAIVTLNDDTATVFERTIQALTQGRATPDPDPHGPPDVDTYRGTPEFKSNKFVLSIGDVDLSARDFVIATGSLPKIPPIQNLAETPHHTPLSLLTEQNIPSSVLILGAGPVGVSLAQILIASGKKPLLMVRGNRILPKEEPEISEVLERHLVSSGVRVLKNAHLVQTRSLPDKKVSCVYESNEEQKEIKVEAFVLATGFAPNMAGLKLENLKPYQNGGGSLCVDDLIQTSTPHLWAAGSVTGFPSQIGFHEHQAELLVNNLTAMFFSKTRLENEPYPFTIPTNPPVARLGMSQKEAEQEYKDCKTVVVPVSSFSDSSSAGGLVKLIGRKRSGDIVGVHIVGPHAEEMILFFNLAKRAEICLYDLLDRQHFPSPTYGDSIYHAIKKWTTS